MSGKPYTMMEMKTIVEYLVENRAYGEIKGRKMWMDLASSKVINRTWQSLKETFLKRILPDIHSPYYKLSVTQIASFRQGQDIEKRLNNKLQIRTTSQNSDTDGVKGQDTEKPGNSNGKNEDKTEDEDPILANLRASTETLVLEDCYENAEEIKKDLESPNRHEGENDKEMQPTKSMRELITYSEPLTPMLQSVIDDFTTDDEERESQMQIVEAEDTTEKNNENAEEQVTIEISDSEGNDVQVQKKTNQNLTKNTDVDHPSSPNENEQALVPSSATKTEVINEKSSTLLSETNDINNGKAISEVKIAEGGNPQSSYEITQNNSANTDSLLPANQEAFEEKIKTMPDKRNLSLKNKTNQQNGRKRASSQDLPRSPGKKRILSKVKSISDTDKSNPINEDFFKKSKDKKISQRDIRETSSNINSENGTIQEEPSAENLQNTVSNSSAEIENPCLKNVSLYAEQFSTKKYTDSDSSDMEADKNGNERKTKKRDDNIWNTEDKNKNENDKKRETDDKNNQTEVNNDKTGDIHNKKDDNNENTKDKNVNNEDNTKNRNNNDKTDDENGEKGHKSKGRISENDKAGDKNNKRSDKDNSTANQTFDQDDKNDIVILKSHSDSASESANDPVKRVQERLVKRQRDRALANMFGFTSGGTSRRQRRGTDRRKRTSSHSHVFNYGNMSTASSDMSSDTGSEYVSSPPRQYGRKGRHSRKYLRPRPAPILSLEEEGGLFVMYGKKIYPVVKDGKIVKNYVNYAAEDDADQEEAFWKLKYVEEKKKTAELTKLLNQAKDNQHGEPSRIPPVLPTTTQNINPPVQEERVQQVPIQNVPDTVPVKPVPEPNPDLDEKKTVKIKFIKNNEEIQLEGHWSQLNSVMVQVAQLFQSDPATPSRTSSKTDIQAAEPIVESGKSTPIEEVVEKVNQRENEIAKEIEKLYKEETLALDKPPQTQNNITQRGRGRPRKISPAIPPSPAKRTKVNTETEKNLPLENVRRTTAEAVIPATRTRRSNTPLTPKKVFPETAKADQRTIIRTRRSAARESKEKTVDTKQASPEDLDEDIRYKFPSPPPTIRKSYANKSSVAMKRKTKSATNLPSSTENVFDPIERTQVYQDSSLNIKNTGKTCLSTDTTGYSTRSIQRTNPNKTYDIHSQQRTNSNMTEDISTESSNSFHSDHIESMTFQNSTLASDIYKSDSYRLLMNKNPPHNKNISTLEKIVEADFNRNEEVVSEIANSDNIGSNNTENMIESLQVNTDNENSSSVSLPTSPVLSIVENISISKTFLSSMDLDDYPSTDKQEDIDATKHIMLNGLMTPDDNVMPLMEQECGIEKSCHHGKAYHYNLRVSKTVRAVSDSLLNKINSVNIADPTLSESLNARLSDLLLESAKKSIKDKDTVNFETEDIEMKENPVPSKKANSRKRSSTPRKRQRTQKLTLTNTQPRIVEEHVESCSQLSRQSCPPIILISQHDNNVIITPNETESVQFLTVKPRREKKKKDIIKVKIAKPAKQKYRANISDSGINDTESEIKLQGTDDSVDLIHNHSDTCLNAHECMGDSVNIVENSTISIISLNTTSAHSDINVSHNNGGNLTQELYSSDAQDGSDVVKEFEFQERTQVNGATATVHNTALGTQSSPNSIMTDDLSEEIPEESAKTKKWYFFSDDESSNTNCFKDNRNSKATACGANLEQIFPVICAVPDLSTITEMSRDTVDNKNFCDDTNTKDMLNSPSIFN